MYIILMSQTGEVNNVRIPRPRLVATFYRILETLLTTAMSTCPGPGSSTLSSVWVTTNQRVYQPGPVYERARSHAK